MRCGTARAAMIEHRLGALPTGVDAELRRHLASCPTCAAEAVFETRLADDLACLRSELPGTVDVRSRVAAEIAELASPERREVPASQLGWAAALAFALACLLLIGVLGSLPEMLDALRQGRGVASAAGEVLTGLWRPLVALLSVPLGLAQALFGMLGALGSTLELMRPVATATVWAAYAAMISTILVVVGRDWLRPATLSPAKEP